jgi:hypothetical protein
VIAIAPAATAFLPTAASPHGRRVRELMIRDQNAAIEPGRRLLVRHGITVLEGAPGVPLDHLMSGRRAA